MIGGQPLNLDTDPEAHIAGDMIFGDERERPDVPDHLRLAKPGEPPVPGAQWNELQGQWERWDEDSQAWVVVGDAGSGVRTFWEEDGGTGPG